MTATPWVDVVHITGRERVLGPRHPRSGPGDVIYPARDETGRLVIFLDSAGVAEPIVAIGRPGQPSAELAQVLHDLALATQVLDTQPEER